MMMKQFTSCSLSKQITCYTYGFHVGNLKPKLDIKRKKFSHEQVALMPSTIVVT